jgi:Leucine rich repeat
LSSNQFTGNGVPTQIGLLTDLKYLFIAMNPNLYQSPIPTEIGQLKELIDVSFQNSNRIGKIPYHIEALQLLTTLDLNNNYLSGPIPEELSNLPQLRFLLLRGNQLTGSIPSTISRLTHLDTVLLDSNSNLNSGTEHMCAVKPLPRILQADCSTFDMGCECCTTCCDTDVDVDCNNKIYYSNLDPSAEYHYVRKFYQFNEFDKLFPVASVPKNELPLYFEDEYGEQFAIDNPDGLVSYGGLYEYSPYDYDTNNAAVANPFEEYIEDENRINGTGTDVITTEQIYQEGDVGQEVNSFEDVYQNP